VNVKVMKAYGAKELLLHFGIIWGKCTASFLDPCRCGGTTSVTVLL